MKKLTRLVMKNVMGGTGSNSTIEGDEACGKTGEYCTRGQKCCDSAKGYQGTCPSQEAAKCD